MTGQSDNSESFQSGDDNMSKRRVQFLIGVPTSEYLMRIIYLQVYIIYFPEHCLGVAGLSLSSAVKIYHRYQCRRSQHMTKKLLNCNNEN